MNYALKAGLMLNEYFGAEILYSDLGKTLNGDGNSKTVNTYDLLVKAQYPSKAFKFLVYGKLGLGKFNISHSNQSYSHSPTIFGVGLGYQFMPQLQATLASRGVYIDEMSSTKRLFYGNGLGLNYSF